MTEAGEQDLTCSGEKQFCSLFNTLEIKEGTGGESRAGIGCRGVQPAALGPHAARDGCECGPTQNRKFI